MAELIVVGRVRAVRDHWIDNKAAGYPPRRVTRIELEVEAWGVGGIDRTSGELPDPVFELAPEVPSPTVGDRLRLTCTTATGRRVARWDVDPIDDAR